MAVLYTPHFVQFFENDGITPAAGGKLYTYAAGTTTPKATYTTAAGDIEHANPIILDSVGRTALFISGAYKFSLYDSDDNLIKTTDDITSFNATTSTNEGFFQSFSGTGAQTAFTLTDNLGTDEKALFVFAENEYSTNGLFASDTGWTKGTGWTIAAGVATATGAISTALEQTAGLTLIQGKAYSVQYTITRDAGSITLSLGGTAGTARSAAGTYSETIIAGSTQTISFGTSGFTGTLDNVSIRDVTGPVIKNPNTYTLNGTSLTFNVAPASGNNNILVFAPYSLIGAAGAAQVAADAAIAAQAGAEAAEDNAVSVAASVVGLNATSTTSLAIGTGSKVFTIQADKGFIAGMWILATSDADPTNYMHGYVDSYSGTTLTMEVTNVGGSGTLADWTIRVSGTRGAAGSYTGDAELDAIAGLTSAANKIIRFTGSGSADLIDFLDEDDMASDSATAVPSQQSVKAYVDASGALKQVVSTHKNDTFAHSSSSFADVTGLSVAITPTSASSRVKLTVTISIGMDAATDNSCFVKLLRDSTEIGNGASDGASRVECIASVAPFNNNAMQTTTIVFVDSPATTSEVTYKVQIAASNSGDVYVNRSATDSNTTVYARASSSIIAEEIV